MINVDSKYWQGRVENILNLLVHEIFHAGYSYCRELQEEKGTVDETVYKMLDNMHSEGVCTYVGYQALPIFPAPDVDDYKMLERLEEVKRLLGDVNEVFSQVGEGEEALRKFIWERCIQGRGYYVVGAYMCQVIEEKTGRDGLIQTLVEGPVSFLRLYNSLVKEELQVRAEL